MNCVAHVCVILFTSIILSGFVILFIGISDIPQSLTQEEKTDPTTHSLYPIEQQNALLKQKVLSSDSFKLTMIGCGFLGLLLISFLGVLLRRYYQRRNALILPQPPISLEGSNVAGVAPYTLEWAPSPPHNSGGRRQPSQHAETGQALPEPVV